ncbi:MAG: M81 family metallopeptidase [Actinobacteria bacterium]|nr:M81 family metallopeptidase [Actinomycetota bacterium]
MKIAVGAFSIESNSFAHGVTSLDDFKKQIYFVGSAISRECAGPTVELAGAWDVFTKHGVEIVPTLVATSSPRPPVTRDAFEVISSGILSAIPSDVDGVYLSLHGASYCEHDDDPEGTLLEMVREKIGPEKLISISLDLHAYYTKKMLAHADIATAYRTAPHIDLYETGARAAQLLVDALAKKQKPKVYRAEAAMITSAERHDNTKGPFKELIDLCRNAEAKPGALTVSLLATQPWLDVEELGWKVIVTTSSADVDGQTIADEIAREAWNRREQFMETVALSPTQALHEAVTAEGLCAVSDLGDATNGGSPGDSTVLLREALRSRDSGTFILSLADAAGATYAYQTGAGKEITLSLCDGAPGEYNERTTITGVIEKVANKKIQYTHPAAGGSLDDPGPSALIKITTSPLTTYLVLHANPVRVIDPVIYELFDLDVRQFSAVQAKSPNGFKVGFARVTNEYRLANTEGPTSADLFTLTFNKRPKPLFPFERM